MLILPFVTIRCCCLRWCSDHRSLRPSFSLCLLCCGVFCAKESETMVFGSEAISSLPFATSTYAETVREANDIASYLLLYYTTILRERWYNNGLIPLRIREHNTANSVFLLFDIYMQCFPCFVKYDLAFDELGAYLTSHYHLNIRHVFTIYRRVFTMRLFIVLIN